MPEYLAPGVYVEEVDTGSKPIEGVSTSTSGMVGVAERGPLNVPVLVTSLGDYSRTFGGQLNADDYADHRFLPHAVEGFFTNGGKRAYIVRVLDDAATKAESHLFDRGTAGISDVRLLRAAGLGTGTVAAPPGIVTLATAGLAAGDWVRVGDGSGAEYHQLDGAPVAANDVMIPLDLPLLHTHVDPETVADRTPNPGAGFTLVDAVAHGASVVRIDGAAIDVGALAVGAILEFGPAAEYRAISQIVEIAAGTAAGHEVAHVQLDSPLVLSWNAATVVTEVALMGALAPVPVKSAAAGSSLAFVDTLGGGGNYPAGHLAVFGTGATQEIRRIAGLTHLTIEQPVAQNMDAGTLAEAMAPAPPWTTVAATVTTLTLHPGQTGSLVAGQKLVVDPLGAPHTVTIVMLGPAADQVTITALPAAPAAGTEVDPAAKRTTAASAAGTRVLSLDDRMGLVPGTLLRIGPAPAGQVVTVTGVPAVSGLAPDPGNVAVTPPLASAVANNAVVSIVDLEAATPATALALGAAAGDTDLYVGDGTAFGAPTLVRLTQADGEADFSYVTAHAADAGDILTLQTPLSRSHPAGSVVAKRSPLIDVQALDAGIWGQRLRVSVTDDEPGLVSRTTIALVVNPTTIRLGSRAGVQPGTVLEISDEVTGAVIDSPVKVNSVDRVTGNVILGGPLTAGQSAVGRVVRSREFTISVALLRQPDPATPSRDSQVIDREQFRNLSLDPRHSNYVEKVIGPKTGPLRPWDHRTDGSSLYIRVEDVAATQAAKEAVRVGPEALVDGMPDGRQLPALMRLEEVIGDDSIGTLTDAEYLGADNVDPEQRTGLVSLRNVEEISLVAIPGRTSAQVQQGVIDHCEEMRYRFAVMDTVPEPHDTIVDAQNQRQQFDTKYAALYYPWLSIPDPFPANLADVHGYAIPPSGHMLGVYARTDIERGVHKAPANEVVQGITGLRRTVNKEQQDILNPYPVNINVIRDFRTNNRGIRVYGGRVITSDPDWKYVNVRRLLIFIEASIDRGLQWVVFEPNSEPLWARVQRVITNFLTVVWRNGALEGTKPEEAFFVRCDRTTMTQTDIDNGRLIVQVGVAPVKPAEFVIVRIGLWTARSDS